jgi:hypothetical protein
MPRDEEMQERRCHKPMNHLLPSQRKETPACRLEEQPTSPCHVGQVVCGAPSISCNTRPEGPPLASSAAGVLSNAPPSSKHATSVMFLIMQVSYLCEVRFRWRTSWSTPWRWPRSGSGRSCRRVRSREPEGRRGWGL